MSTKKTFFALVCSPFLMYNCTSDNLENDHTSTTANQNYPELGRISSVNNVTFTAANQAITSETSAETIFNNDISGWDNVASINSNNLSVALQSATGTTGAMECRIDVSDNPKYELVFDVAFQSGFDFSKGGKVGFGFAVGDGVTGGRNTEATIDNRGGSFG